MQLRFHASLAALAGLFALCSSCSGLGYHKQVTVEHPRVELASGLAYEDVLTGVGEEASRGSTVTLDYTGWFEDGSEFDSSHDRGTPSTFLVGEAPLAGWDEGLIGMRSGGQRKLFLPPALAYGEEGVPGLVPPNAPLVFLIELIEVAPPEVPGDASESAEPVQGTADDAE